VTKQLHVVLVVVIVHGIMLLILKDLDVNQLSTAIEVENLQIFKLLTMDQTVTWKENQANQLLMPAIPHAAYLQALIHVDGVTVWQLLAKKLQLQDIEESFISDNAHGMSITAIYLIAIWKRPNISITSKILTNGLKVSKFKIFCLNSDFIKNLL
jgi:hypothetical protein